MKQKAVYPATLDPIHYGHIDIATRAAEIFDEVIVAIYDKPKKQLLFTPQERMELAQEAFINHSNIRVALFSGLVVNYVKSVDARVLVRGLRVFSDFEFEFRMALANRKLAPTIETVSIISDERYVHISSSTVREVAELGGDVSSMVPKFVHEALIRRYDELSRKSSS
ncbi:MAG TPA: pantetheine-phosphate adenylyltransferase [Aggregatilineales bacterium]|nr:pantetheine-phosphate adenylyltransferase [Aggregatilineales bacterium]